MKSASKIEERRSLKKYGNSKIIQSLSNRFNQNLSMNLQHLNKNYNNEALEYENEENPGTYGDQNPEIYGDQNYQDGGNGEHEARDKFPEEEYSIQLMKLYPLGFNEYEDESNEEEEEDEEEEENRIEDNQYDNIYNEKTENSSSKRQFVTPRKKKKTKKNKSGSNKNTNSANIKEQNHNAQEGEDGEDEEETEEQINYEEEYIEEEAEGEGGEEEEEEDDGDDGDRPPCIYNVWVPDCSRTRQDFLVCQQIDLNLLTTKHEFESSLNEKGFYTSASDYEDFQECQKSAKNRILQGTESRFGVEIDVSDAFYALNGAKMRAYSFQGPYRKIVYSSFIFFQSSWTVEMSLHSITDYDFMFRSDDWYYSVILIDQPPKIRLYDRDEEGPTENQDKGITETDEEEQQQQPEVTSPQEATDEEEDSKPDSPKAESPKGESPKGESPKGESPKADSKKDDDDDDDDDDETTNASNINSSKAKEKTEKNNNYEHLKVGHSTFSNEINSEKSVDYEALENANNENTFSSGNGSENEPRFKYCLKYFKNSKIKFRKLFSSLLRNENDSLTCTISKMAKLVNINNNKFTDSLSYSESKIRLQYKIRNFLMDDNNNPIPIWIKTDKDAFQAKDIKNNCLIKN